MKMVLVKNNVLAKNITKVCAMVFDIILEAIFPISASEKELLTLSPSQARNILPASPDTPEPNTFSVFHYKDERVSKMIWAIKYKKSKSAISIGGYALFEKIKEICEERGKNGGKKLDEWSKNNDTKEGCSNCLNFENIIVTPIPITKRRRNERGYNQCELILDEIEKLYADSSHNFSHDIDNKLPCMIFDKNILAKTHHTSRQTLKDRSNRLGSAKGIFAVNEKVAEKYLKDSLVIVIDDVITTGSTIKEAMITLRNHGFKNVIGVSIAH